MSLKIFIDPHENIRTPCKDVRLPLNVEDKKLLDEMLTYIENSQDEKFLETHPDVTPGIGLAAPQVGVLKKMFVVSVDIDGKRVRYKLVNPKIYSTSTSKIALKDGEGCLSIKHKHPGYAHRWYRIKMKAFDALTNKYIDIDAKEFLSIVLQHENDHLLGRLFYDSIVKDAPFAVLPDEILI